MLMDTLVTRVDDKNKDYELYPYSVLLPKEGELFGGHTTCLLLLHINGSDILLK
jgi:hypothetical protein